MTNAHVSDPSPASATEDSDGSLTRYMINDALPQSEMPANSTDSSTTRYMLASSENCPPQDDSTVVNKHPMLTRTKIGTIKPKLPFAGSTTVATIPKNANEALVDPVWCKPINAEFEALQKNHTWSLVPYTPNMHIVGSKWIFKIKYKPNGEVDRHKAMLVAQGYSQAPGLDFFFILLVL